MLNHTHTRIDNKEVTVILVLPVKPTYREEAQLKTAGCVRLQ
jgi:hypothetical protein